MSSQYRNPVLFKGFTVVLVVGSPVVARDTLIWFHVDKKIFMRFSYQAEKEAVE